MFSPLPCSLKKNKKEKEINNQRNDLKDFFNETIHFETFENPKH